MSKLFLAGCAALLGALLVNACGSNPCDDLTTVCNQCQDATYKKSCLDVVAKNGHGVCTSDLAIYRAQCPPAGTGGATASAAAGNGTTTGSTTTATTSGTGGTTSAGGTAGAAATGGAAGAGGTK